MRLLRWLLGEEEEYSRVQAIAELWQSARPAIFLNLRVVRGPVRTIKQEREAA